MSRSMYGLSKLHNACNTAAAWQDWQSWSNVAINRGLGSMVEKLRPPENAGWRTIDKRIAALREAIVNGSNKS